MSSRAPLRSLPTPAPSTVPLTLHLNPLPPPSSGTLPPRTLKLSLGITTPAVRLTKDKDSNVSNVVGKESNKENVNTMGKMSKDITHKSKSNKPISTTSSHVKSQSRHSLNTSTSTHSNVHETKNNLMSTGGHRRKNSLTFDVSSSMVIIEKVFTNIINYIYYTHKNNNSNTTQNTSSLTLTPSPTSLLISPPPTPWITNLCVDFRSGDKILHLLHVLLPHIYEALPSSTTTLSNGDVCSAEQRRWSHVDYLLAKAGYYGHQSPSAPQNPNISITHISDSRMLLLDSIQLGSFHHTIHFLWSFLLKYYIYPHVIPSTLIRNEMGMIRKFNTFSTPICELYMNCRELSDLMQWAQLIIQLYIRNKKDNEHCEEQNAMSRRFPPRIAIQNFTSSFGNGVALLLLVHYYYPSMVSLEDIAMDNDGESMEDRNEENNESINGDHNDGDNKVNKWSLNISMKELAHHRDEKSEERLFQHNFHLFYRVIQQLNITPLVALLSSTPYHQHTNSPSSLFPLYSKDQIHMDEKVVILVVSLLYQWLRSGVGMVNQLTEQWERRVEGESGEKKKEKKGKSKEKSGKKEKEMKGTGEKKRVDEKKAEMVSTVSNTSSSSFPSTLITSNSSSSLLIIPTTATKNSHHPPRGRLLKRLGRSSFGKSLSVDWSTAQLPSDVIIESEKEKSINLSTMDAVKEEMLSSSSSFLLVDFAPAKAYGKSKWAKFNPFANVNNNMESMSTLSTAVSPSQTQLQDIVIPTQSSSPHPLPLPSLLPSSHFSTYTSLHLHAAKCIQRFLRHHLPTMRTRRDRAVRREVERVRGDKAVMIQKMWRGYIERKIWLVEMERRRGEEQQENQMNVNNQMMGILQSPIPQRVSNQKNEKDEMIIPSHVLSSSTPSSSSSSLLPPAPHSTPTDENEKDCEDKLSLLSSPSPSASVLPTVSSAASHLLHSFDQTLLASPLPNPSAHHDITIVMEKKANCGVTPRKRLAQQEEEWERMAEVMKKDEEERKERRERKNSTITIRDNVNINNMDDTVVRISNYTNDQDMTIVKEQNTTIAKERDTTIPSSPTTSLPTTIGQFINTEQHDHHQIDINTDTNRLSLSFSNDPFTDGIGLLDPVEFALSSHPSSSSHHNNRHNDNPMNIPSDLSSIVDDRTNISLLTFSSTTANWLSERERDRETNWLKEREKERERVAEEMERENLRRIDMEYERVMKEKIQIEKERVEKERMRAAEEHKVKEKERAEKERERVEMEMRRAAEEDERLRVQKEMKKARDEQERVEKLEKERMEKERAEKERAERERVETERVAVAMEKRREEERVRVEQEMKMAQEEKERAEKIQKLEHERVEKEKVEKQRIESERVEKERVEMEKERERKRVEKIKIRIEKERIEKENQEKERVEKERILKEKQEKERMDKERVEREKIQKDKENKIHEEKEQKDKEMKSKLLSIEREEKKLDKSKSRNNTKMEQITNKTSLLSSTSTSIPIPSATSFKSKMPAPSTATHSRQPSNSSIIPTKSTAAASQVKVKSTTTTTTTTTPLNTKSLSTPPPSSHIILPPSSLFHQYNLTDPFDAIIFISHHAHIFHTTIMLQSLCRRKMAGRVVRRMREEREEKRRREVASVIIQKYYRRYAAKKLLLSLRQRYLSAIVITQKFIRRQLSIRLLSKLRVECQIKRDNSSATLIQSLWKGYKSRIQYHSIRDSIMMIQRGWKCHRARMELKSRIVEHNRRVEMAIRIQKVYKGYKSRKDVGYLLSDLRIKLHHIQQSYHPNTNTSSIPVISDTLRTKKYSDVLSAIHKLETITSQLSLSCTSIVGIPNSNPNGNPSDSKDTNPLILSSLNGITTLLSILSLCLTSTHPIYNDPTKNRHIILASLGILGNMSRYGGTKGDFYGRKDMMSLYRRVEGESKEDNVILKVMNMYRREKEIGEMGMEMIKRGREMMGSMKKEEEKVEKKDKSNTKNNNNVKRMKCLVEYYEIMRERMSANERENGEGKWMKEGITILKQIIEESE